MNTTMQIDVMPVNGSSVTQKALAAIVSSRKRVFREDRDTTPRSIGRYQYMPWGADDQMPYDILDLIEEDEVMTTCQQHVIRTCYGGGLHYETRPSDLLPGTGGEAGEKPASSPLPFRPFVHLPFLPFVICRSVLPSPAAGDSRGSSRSAFFSSLSFSAAPSLSSSAAGDSRGSSRSAFFSSLSLSAAGDSRGYPRSHSFSLPSPVVPPFRYLPLRPFVTPFRPFVICRRR